MTEPYLADLDRTILHLLADRPCALPRVQSQIGCAISEAESTLQTLLRLGLVISKDDGVWQLSAAGARAI
jgi:DNA-binding IclR family transcriptional regulator